MADNSGMGGTDTIATDDVATLNGAASSGVKVQRTKVTYGDDGTARDVSSSFPLPVAAVGPGTVTWVNAPAAVSITTTAADVLTAGSYRMVAFDNIGASTVYLGTTGVTSTAYVLRLAPGERVILTGCDCPTNVVRGLTASGTSSLEVGVGT